MILQRCLKFQRKINKMTCCKENVPEFIFTLNEGLDDNFLPKQSTEQDTGWDVKAAETITLYPTQKVLIPLGLRCFAPPGYWLELRPRSSSFGKKNLHALYGVLDEGYEGQIYFACQWIPPFSSTEMDLAVNGFDGGVRAEILKSYFSQTLIIENGERIGQLIPVRRQSMNVSPVSTEEFKKLCEDRGQKRGAGGFGSSGK